MKRRHFLQRTALLGASGLISVGTHGWVWRGAAQTVSSPRLIVIFLRGAVDGLNVVVPYQESDYYELRPTIALAKPGETDGVLDLDGEFGLHPALAPLMPEWQAGHLAFVQACGLRDTSRSHFQAQDYLETGTLDVTSLSKGWLNRLLALLPNSTSTQAVNIGENLPLIFAGSESVASLTVKNGGISPLLIDQPRLQAAFDDLYANHDQLGPVYKEGRIARDSLLRELTDEMKTASKGAPTPAKFVASAQYLAQLMSGDARTQLAFMELGGWDTHVNETRLLNRHLGSLGAGLTTLVQGLGAVYENTVIVVMSEFGRTVAENGSGGTDHGYGNALWLMGGGIRGRRLYGKWPGLEPSDKDQLRDLAITTDIRDVLLSLLGQQFDLGADLRSQLFPNYQPQTTFQLL